MSFTLPHMAIVATVRAVIDRVRAELLCWHKRLANMVPREHIEVILLWFTYILELWVNHELLGSVTMKEFVFDLPRRPHAIW